MRSKGNLRVSDGAMLFAYRLAKELGIWDVYGMLSEMTWAQFVGWMRYYGQEPFGEERADLRSAITSSVVANTSRDPKRRPQPFSPRDFMPFKTGGSHTREYAPMTDRQQWRELTQTMKTAFGSAISEDTEEQQAN